MQYVLFNLRDLELRQKALLIQISLLTKLLHLRYQLNLKNTFNTIKNSARIKSKQLEGIKVFN